MKNFNKDDAYVRAKYRVDQVRGFYVHFMIYLIVNSGITVFKVYRNMSHGETFNEAFFDLATYVSWIVWGLGLAIHCFAVFGLPMILGKNWEQKKLEQFMQEELENMDTKD